jgi:hypothetical protein
VSPSQSEDITVKRRTWKKYAGPSISGSGEVLPTPSMADTHWMRAFWLTSMVESGGRIGAIVMYDGTAVTAGLHQAVAVYPRDLKAQGPLFALLRRLDYVVPVPYFLGDLFDEHDWFVAPDSKLRYKSDGDVVEPADIRAVLTPPNGVVPRKGREWDQSVRWAKAFHRLFSLDATLMVQTSYGIEHFVKRAKRLRHTKLDRHTIEQLCYGGECLNPEVFSEHHDVKDAKFAPFLIKQLGTAEYGRWDGARYERAYNYAKQVWPDSLFLGRKPVMPRSF